MKDYVFLRQKTMLGILECISSVAPIQVKHRNIEHSITPNQCGVNTINQNEVEETIQCTNSPEHEEAVDSSIDLSRLNYRQRKRVQEFLRANSDVFPVNDDGTVNGDSTPMKINQRRKCTPML